LIAEDVDRDIEIGGHTYTIIGVNIRKITTPIAICRKATREVSFKSVAFIHKILEISPDVFEQLDSNPEHIYAGNFREYAEEYGLTLEHLGQEITYKGKIYKIAGLRFTSKKAPIVVTYDEKRCFAPLALVQKALGVEVSEAPAKPKAAKKSATPKGAHQETEQEDIESPIETPSGPEYVPDPLLVPAPESPAREAALEPAPPPAPGHAPKVKADIPASELEHLLRNAGAREGTLLWAKGKSFTQFWTACQVGTWMLALAGSMAGQPGWPTHQQVSLAACVCAETALKYVPPGENSPKVLIDFVKRWSRGEISDVDVKEVGSKVAAAIAAEPPRGVKNALKAAQATTNLIGGTNGVSVAAAASYAAVAASAIVPESDAPAARAKVDAGCADLVRRELPLSTFSLI
jgi:hypothetical protein